MKKWLSVFVCAVMLLTAASCKRQDAPTDEATGTTVQTSETDLPYATQLPDRTFDGEDFLILTYEDANGSYNTLQSEVDQNSTTYEQAKYQAYTNICDRYRIHLTERTVADNMTSFSTSILSGDDVYALGNCRCTVAYQMYQQGLILSYDSIPYIDLNAGYWDKDINECLSIQGDQYVAVGKYNMSTYGFTHCLLFNKGMVASYGFDDLYRTVTDGSWTFEEMLEMMNAVHTLDGESDSTVYGYLAHAKEVLPSFWIAAGVTSVAKDPNTDVPYLAASDLQFINVFDKVYTMLWDTGNWMVVTTGLDVPEECISAFTSDRSLFMDCTFDILYRKMRNYDGYGIVPYPMYDAELQQGVYSSRVEYYIPSVVPSVTKDLERTGFLLEALNCEYANYVLPEYYENCLVRRSSRDSESAEMLNYIFEHRVIDIGDTTLNGKIRDGIFEKMFRSNNRNLSSQLVTLQTVMEEFIAGFPKNPG